MNSVHVRRVAPPERRKLRHWKRQRTNLVNSCRARVILLSSGHVGNREIAQQVGYTPQWVRIIIHRFNKGGTEGIAWYPYFHGPSGPRSFTADIIEQIAAVALSPPKQLIGMTQWSLA
ncbi:MAG: helix-turn-helix domain-containing protein, partial [Thermoguttaceae bacterium]